MRKFFFYDAQPAVLENLSESELQLVTDYFHSTTDLLQTERVVVDSLEYSKGLFLVHKRDILPQFGRVECIFLCKGELYFLLASYSVYFNEQLGDFCGYESNQLHIITHATLVDPFPLVGYERGNEVIIPLKHWISI